MKKVLREMQTLCTGCSKAEPKLFAMLQTPIPGAQDGQNLISWRWSLPSPTDQVWWKSMHAISSYHGNGPPPARPPAHPPTYRHLPTRHRQDRLQYTALLYLARSVMNTSS